MQFPNRDGVGVDPVPFIVVAGCTFLFVYSYLPIFLIEYGVSVAGSLLASTAVWVWIALGAFHRLVWTYRPERREHVPPGQRFLRLVYAVLVGVALLALLSLPMFAR